MKENVSTVFLLPGIEINNKLTSEFYSQGFVNTYLTCKPLTYPYEVIYLLFKPRVIDADFIGFVNELQKNENFIETLDGGSNKVVLVYKIPAKFHRDYQIFLTGKYSKLSAEFKRCFIMEEDKKDDNGHYVLVKGHRVKEYTTFHHIFNKTDDMKAKWEEILGEVDWEDSELYEAVNLENEDLVEELWLG